MKSLKIKLITLLVCLFISISLSAKQFYTLNLKVFPINSTIHINGKKYQKKSANFKKKLSTGKINIVLQAKGYKTKVFSVKLNRNKSFELKLEKKNSRLTYIKTLKTGGSPKSVEFSPDGKYIFSALLRGQGVDVFSTQSLKKVTTLRPPQKYYKHNNFVELAFIESLNEIWVTQMMISKVHVFDSKTFKYKSTFSVKGNFCKVIAVDKNEKRAYITNWISKDISVVDVKTHKVIKRIKTFGVPRGLVFSEDEKYLYAALFTTGKIQKIDLKRLKVIKTYANGRCMRHIVADYKRGLYYLSDMGKGVVYIYSFHKDKLLKTIKVGYKPNTIKLSADKKYLFVSNRGPNGASYLKKGPKFGRIFVIDTQKRKVVEWIWGMNQPTGLAVSPDGKILAFSDFLDNQIEIYKINTTQNKVAQR